MTGTVRFANGAASSCVWISTSVSSSIPVMLLSTSNTDMKDGSGDCIGCDATITGVVGVLLKEKRCLKPKGVRRSARNREGSVGILVDLGSKRLPEDEEGPRLVIAPADLLRVRLSAAILRCEADGGK